LRFQFDRQDAKGPEHRGYPGLNVGVLVELAEIIVRRFFPRGELNRPSLGAMAGRPARRARREWPVTGGTYARTLSHMEQTTATSKMMSDRIRRRTVQRASAIGYAYDVESFLESQIITSPGTKF
jgi:hypothetical protein